MESSIKLFDDVRIRDKIDQNVFLEMKLKINVKFRDEKGTFANFIETKLSYLIHATVSLIDY